MSAVVVAQAKAELEAAGADLSGPCGAFKITNLTAQKLRLGILDKPAGNNCQGYATDIVMERSGQAWDCLIDGGGANTPAWNQIDPVDASRYRDPIGSPTVPPVEPPVPPVTPPAAPCDLTPVLQAIAALSEQLAVHEAASERRYLDIIAHFEHLPQASATSVSTLFDQFLKAARRR